MYSGRGDNIEKYIMINSTMKCNFMSEDAITKPVWFVIIDNVL